MKIDDTAVIKEHIEERIQESEGLISDKIKRLNT